MLLFTYVFVRHYNYIHIHVHVHYYSMSKLVIEIVSRNVVLIIVL